MSDQKTKMTLSASFTNGRMTFVPACDVSRAIFVFSKISSCDAGGIGNLGKVFELDIIGDKKAYLKGKI